MRIQQHRGKKKKTTALCNLPAATGPTPPLYVPYVTAAHDTETGSLIRPYRRGKNTTHAHVSVTESFPLTVQVGKAVLTQCH